jgi:hypothetical protein
LRNASSNIPTDIFRNEAGQGNRFVFVFWGIIVLIQPVLDRHRCVGAGEHESGLDKASRRLDFDLAQTDSGADFIFRKPPATPEPPNQPRTGLPGGRAGHSGAGFGPRAFPGLLIFQFSDRGSTP